MISILAVLAAIAAGLRLRPGLQGERRAADRTRSRAEPRRPRRRGRAGDLGVAGDGSGAGPEARGARDAAASPARWVVTEVYRREQRGPRAWVGWYARESDAGAPLADPGSAPEFGWTEKQARRRAEWAIRQRMHKERRRSARG